MPSAFRAAVWAACLLSSAVVAQPRPADAAARIDSLSRVALDDASVPAAEAALALAQRAGTPVGLGRAQYALAYARYSRGDLGTDRLFARAAATARRAGDARTEGVALAWQGMVVGDRDGERGLAIGRRAVAVHQTMRGDAGRRARLVSLNLLANQHAFAGQTDAAAALHRRIVREARLLGDAKSIGLSSYTLGDYALAAGDLVGALRHYGAATEAAQSVGGEPDWFTDVEAGQARVEAALGRVDEAAATLRRLAETEAARGQAGYASGYYLQLGEAYREAGRTDDAIGAYRAGRDVLATSEYAAYRYEFVVFEAGALFEAGRTPAARQTLRPAADSVVANPAAPEAHALALTLLARAARLDGRPQEAAALAARAVAVADEAGLVRHTRDALTERAAALEATGDAAAALGAFRQSAALTDSLRSTAQAREVGRLQAEAAFADERAADARRRQHLLWGLVSVVSLGALAAVGGGGYVRTVRRKNAEIERQADALASANADLAQTNAVVREAREAQARFFQTASHELRTPLTLTVGPLDDLLRGLHGPLDGAARRAAGLAASNAGRLARLVDDLLDAARLDAGQTPHRPAPEDLAALVADATLRFQAHAERGGIDLGVDVPGDPVPAEVDATTIERALGTLLANALRHTPSGGRVAVRLATGNGLARVSVADTGPGVAPDLQGHLFDRFYRAEERAGVGSGLGLALAKEWAERHGGHVEVESVPGEGATFTLVLPLPEAPARAIATPPEADEDDDTSDNAEALVVLVAEDHTDLRGYIAGHLGRDDGAGFDRPARVVQAADGDEALALARDLVPDLVVSDVMMPGRDGFELTRALKADVRTSHVPVLLLTARADAPGTVEGFRAGADGYLAKPFDPDVLRAQAAALVAERQRLRERVAQSRGLDGGVSDGPPHGDSQARREPEPPALSPAERRFLDAVDAAIADALSDAAFGAGALAETLALSPRQLRRKLQAVAGDSPVARIRRARADAGAALLDDGLSLKEAAAAVGYADSGGLRRALTAVHGGEEAE